MIPIEILVSSRLYAPLVLAIWVLLWSILRDDRRLRDDRVVSAQALARAR